MAGVFKQSRCQLRTGTGHSLNPHCVDHNSDEVDYCQFTYEYNYDTVNRLIDVHDALGNRIAYKYDVEGNQTREEFQDPASDIKRFTNFSYDAFNQLQFTYYSDTPEPPTSGAVFEERTYRDDGLLQTVKDPLGHVTEFDYDDFKRMTSMKQTVGSETLTTSYRYDIHDNVIEITDPRDLSTSYAYDDLGRRVETLSPDAGTTHYLYDEAGNLVSTTTGTGFPLFGNTTH